MCICQSWYIRIRIQIWVWVTSTKCLFCLYLFTLKDLLYKEDIICTFNYIHFERNVFGLNCRFIWFLVRDSWHLVWYHFVRIFILNKIYFMHTIRGMYNTSYNRNTQWTSNSIYCVYICHDRCRHRQCLLPTTNHYHSLNHHNDSGSFSLKIKPSKN